MNRVYFGDKFTSIFYPNTTTEVNMEIINKENARESISFEHKDLIELEKIIAWLKRAEET